MREEAYRGRLAGKGLTALKKIFWKYKSEYVRRLADGVCFTCKTKKPWRETFAGHFYHSKRFDLAYHRYNIQCQCNRCNRMLSGNLNEFAYYLGKKYGWQILDELHDLKHQVKERVNQTLIRQVVSAIIEYRNLIDELKENSKDA